MSFNHRCFPDNDLSLIYNKSRYSENVGMWITASMKKTDKHILKSIFYVHIHSAKHLIKSLVFKVYIWKPKVLSHMLEVLDVSQSKPADYRVLQDYLIYRKVLFGPSIYLAIFIAWRWVITEQKENQNKIMKLILGVIQKMMKTQYDV